MSDAEGIAVVEERLDVRSDAAFVMLSAAGEGGCAIAVLRARPQEAADEDTLMVTGDAWPEPGANGFVVLGAAMPLGSTLLELDVAEVPAIRATAQVQLVVELEDGLLALDVEEDDGDAPLDGWEIDLGAGGAYRLGIDLHHATGPSRAVLVVEIAPEPAP